jgi:hypothetical protein
VVPALGGEETGYDDVGVADDIARMLKCMARLWPAIPTGARARTPSAIHELTIGIDRQNMAVAGGIAWR